MRSARLGVSARLAVRPLVVGSVLLALALVVFAWSLALGEFPIPFGDVVATLAGQGRPDTDFVVRTLRLPRGLAAVLVGAAFGLSGAIFQRVARNPLASPDIIGVTAGAAACAVLTIVMLDGTADHVTLGALAGATIASIAIYLLSYRRGVTGYRLVLVGIGVTAMLTSTTSYLMTRAEIYDAQRAMVIARRLVRGSGAALLPSAAVGAALLAASDLVARRLFAPTELPVGIVTAVIGAPYLLWLLARANRIGSAG